MSLLKKLFGKNETPTRIEIQDALAKEPKVEPKVEPAPKIEHKPIETRHLAQIYEMPEFNPDWDGSDSEQAVAVREALSKYVEKYLFSDEEQRWAHRFITQGKLNDEKPKVVAEKLAATIGRDYKMCREMVLTVNAQIATDTQLKKLIELGQSQYQVFCNLDRKTCPRCGQHDLKIYSIADGPKPPFHKSCRCSIAMVQSDTAGATRPAKNLDSKTIRVPVTMSWSEWHESYVPKAKSPAEKSVDADKSGRKPLSDGIDWGMPNMQQVEAVEGAIPKYVDAHLFNTEELEKAREIIVQGIMDGSQYELIASKLSEAIGRDFDECYDLAHTVMAQAHVDGECKSLTMSGTTQYQIYAVLDRRTCPCCGQYDRKVYDLADGPKPPFHKNCRCSIGTVLPSNLGISRIARDENDKSIQVPGTMTWEEWRKIYAFAPAVPEPDHKKI